MGNTVTELMPKQFYKTFFMTFWTSERGEEKGVVHVEGFADNLTVVLDECSLWPGKDGEKWLKPEGF